MYQNNIFFYILKFIIDISTSNDTKKSIFFLNQIFGKHAASCVAKHVFAGYLESIMYYN
jgi:hypothetical protein